MPKKVFEKDGKLKISCCGGMDCYSPYLVFENKESYTDDSLEGLLEDFEGKYIKLTVEEYTCEDCKYSINDEEGKNVVCKGNIEDKKPEFCPDKD